MQGQAKNWARFYAIFADAQNCNCIVIFWSKFNLEWWSGLVQHRASLVKIEIKLNLSGRLAITRRFSSSSPSFLHSQICMNGEIIIHHHALVFWLNCWPVILSVCLCVIVGMFCIFAAHNFCISSLTQQRVNIHLTLSLLLKGFSGTIRTKSLNRNVSHQMTDRQTFPAGYSSR